MIINSKDKSHCKQIEENNENIKKTEEFCPICLDKIEADDNVLCMPLCMHKIHTACELKAAQYDSRCPICRTKDPEITSRQDDDLAMYSNLENLANEHNRTVQTYNRKRARIIRKHSRLRGLRNALKKEKEFFNNTDKELEREWIKAQKEIWNNNTEITRLKKKRRQHQQKSNTLCKRLEKELEDKVGPRPECSFLQNIQFHIDVE